MWKREALKWVDNSTNLFKVQLFFNGAEVTRTQTQGVERANRE